MHYEVVVIGAGTALVVEELFLLDVCLIAILNTNDAVRVAIRIVRDIALVLR